MISGVTKEFGQVSFDGAKVPVENMVGAPGEGWPLAMTVVGHEREPSTLGFAARYDKLVRSLAKRERRCAVGGAGLGAPSQAEMLTATTCGRRLSEQLDGATARSERIASTSC